MAGRVLMNKDVADLNKWSFTGTFTIGRMSFNICSAAMDGSCCYHSYYGMIKHRIGQ